MASKTRKASNGEIAVVVGIVVGVSAFLFTRIHPAAGIANLVGMLLLYQNDLESRNDHGEKETESVMYARGALPHQCPVCGETVPVYETEETLTNCIECGHPIDWSAEGPVTTC